MARTTEKGTRNAEAIVKSILQSIEDGKPTLPWSKPWDLVGHVSVKSGHAYQGGNGLWCAIWAEVAGFESTGWGTFNQLVGGPKTRGGKPRDPGVLHAYKGSLRGESGIGLWRPIFAKKEDEKTGRMKQVLVRFSPFVAFNLSQVKYGGDEPRWTALGRLERLRLEAKIRDLTAREEREARPIAEIDEALRPFEASLIGGINFSDQTNRACYSPLADRVSMPTIERFARPEAFYSTRFHEDAHASGHKNRLGRLTAEFEGGDHSYSHEELVAELAAAILRAEFGIENPDEAKQTEAYVRTWAERIRGMDDRTLYKAMGQAAKAADWVLNGDPALREEEGEEAREETESATC